MSRPQLIGKATVIGLSLLLTLCCQDKTQRRTKFNWKSDWSVKESFSLSMDSTGYHFPTSIAFVPNPGSDPKDPLYFVAELRGKVKVVTNDRTVHIFAENFFRLTPENELPEINGQVGLAGLCLDPERGYVFATFAYQDANHFLQNNIVRFSSNPRVFSLKPSGQVAFSQVFQGQGSAPAHQIGNCQVVGDSLYAGVGEAQRPYESQRLNTVLGKVLRMSLDGKPVKENPFYQDHQVNTPADYIYATGLRNPFAIRSVGGRVFVADNGNRLDRFIEIQAGTNYLWDGSEWSIGARAQGVFFPSFGPVQMDYYPSQPALFPQEYRNRFYLAVSGAPQTQGPTPGKGVISFQYDFENNRMVDVPEYLVQYRGSDFQAVAGLGLGPDGLYFAPLYPNQKGISAILKLMYQPKKGHPFNLTDDLPAGILMQEKGCYGCHNMSAQDTPVLGLSRDRLLARISERLQSDEYRSSVKKLEEMKAAYYPQYSHVRQTILEQEANNAVRTWMKYHLLEPRFDNPNSQMPNLGLTEKQAAKLTSFLIGSKENPRLTALDKIKQALWQKEYLLPFLIGLGAGLIPLALMALRPFSNRKQRNRTDA